RLYDPGDATDLTDGVLATGGLFSAGKRPFVDDRWVVWTRDAKWAAGAVSDVAAMQGAAVTVDLQQARDVGTVAVHLCNATAMNAPFPEVSIALSEDGKEFVKVAAATATSQGYLEPPGWPRVDWFVLRPLHGRARYVKLNFAF